MYQSREIFIKTLRTGCINDQVSGKFNGGVPYAPRLQELHQEYFLAPYLLPTAKQRRFIS